MTPATPQLTEFCLVTKKPLHLNNGMFAEQNGGGWWGGPGTKSACVWSREMCPETEICKKGPSERKWRQRPREVSYHSQTWTFADAGVRSRSPTWPPLVRSPAPFCVQPPGTARPGVTLFAATDSPPWQPGIPVRQSSICTHQLTPLPVLTHSIHTQCWGKKIWNKNDC